jgi:adenine-specific DNA-methyltransferase
MQLTRHELIGHAKFIGDSSFSLTENPFPEWSSKIPLGLYELPRRAGEAHLYRPNHPLAEGLVARAKRRQLPAAAIDFDYGKYQGKISALEPLINKAGWLEISLFSVLSLDQAEDHIIVVGITDDGKFLDVDTAGRLIRLPGRVVGEIPVEHVVNMGAQIEQRQDTIQRDISERNGRLFEAETEKLDGWADDLKVALEREIRELDRQIREVRRAATTALTLEGKLAAQKQTKSIEAQRNQKRRSLFDAQDQVDKQREDLIAVIEGKLKQTTSRESLFVLRWKLN